MQRWLWLSKFFIHFCTIQARVVLEKALFWTSFSEKKSFLPSFVLSTTCTICELKYAKERCLVAHFKTKDPKTGLLTKRIKLKKPENCGNKSYLDQITPYVHMESNHESGSEYKKVEIFWPHELLQVRIKNHKPTIQKNTKTRLENFFSSSSSCLKILNL